MKIETIDELEVNVKTTDEKKIILKNRILEIHNEFYNLVINKCSLKDIMNVCDRFLFIKESFKLIGKDRKRTNGYVYYIVNLTTNQLYIGRSINLISRISDYVSDLQKKYGSQLNKDLLNDVIVYGLENFTIYAEYHDNCILNETKIITEYYYNNYKLYNKMIKK